MKFNIFFVAGRLNLPAFFMSKTGLEKQRKEVSYLCEQWIKTQQYAKDTLIAHCLNMLLTKKGHLATGRELKSDSKTAQIT